MRQVKRQFWFGFGKGRRPVTTTFSDMGKVRVESGKRELNKICNRDQREEAIGQ